MTVGDIDSDVDVVGAISANAFIVQTCDDSSETAFDVVSVTGSTIIDVDINSTLRSNDISVEYKWNWNWRDARVEQNIERDICSKPLEGYSNDIHRKKQ